MSKRTHKSIWELRRKERELAFQVLYGVSFSEAPNLDALEKAFLACPHEETESDQTGELEGFTWNLVHGVWDNEKLLDREIKKYSHNWRLERMGRIELLILRMALYELQRLGTPDKVVISEYLTLADHFGVETAKGFINGILDRVAKNMAQNEDI